MRSLLRFRPGLPDTIAPLVKRSGYLSARNRATRAPSEYPTTAHGPSSSASTAAATAAATASIRMLSGPPLSLRLSPWPGSSRATTRTSGASPAMTGCQSSGPPRKPCRSSALGRGSSSSGGAPASEMHRSEYDTPSSAVETSTVDHAHSKLAPILSCREASPLPFLLSSRAMCIAASAVCGGGREPALGATAARAGTVSAPYSKNSCVPSPCAVLSIDPSSSTPLACSASSMAASAAHAARPTELSNAELTTARAPWARAACARAAARSRPPTTEGLSTTAAMPAEGGSKRTAAVSPASSSSSPSAAAAAVEKVPSSTLSSSATGTPVCSKKDSRC
mmetsp:Transcript_5069/g.17623  ORF Transcript_5069/g.17623 Transcript_5069/m.17623 type:complete len:337 (+) Transcript_5069:2920-3930(+)